MLVIRRLRTWKSTVRNSPLPPVPVTSSHLRTYWLKAQCLFGSGNYRGWGGGVGPGLVGSPTRSQGSFSDLPHLVPGELVLASGRYLGWNRGLGLGSLLSLEPPTQPSS